MAPPSKENSPPQMVPAAQNLQDCEAPAEASAYFFPLSHTEHMAGRAKLNTTDIWIICTTAHLY